MGTRLPVTQTLSSKTLCVPQKSTKGSVVLDLVLDHVKLAETDYFGLRYCDRSHQTVSHQ